MLKGKSLLEYTNSFSPNDYEKNDKTRSCLGLSLCLTYFMWPQSEKSATLKKWHDTFKFLSSPKTSQSW